MSRNGQSADAAFDLEARQQPIGPRDGVDHLDVLAQCLGGAVRARAGVHHEGQSATVGPAPNALGQLGGHVLVTAAEPLRAPRHAAAVPRRVRRDPQRVSRPRRDLHERGRE